MHPQDSADARFRRFLGGGALGGRSHSSCVFEPVSTSLRAKDREVSRPNACHLGGKRQKHQKAKAKHQLQKTALNREMEKARPPLRFAGSRGQAPASLVLRVCKAHKFFAGGTITSLTFTR